MVVLLAGVGTALSRATWLSAGLMMLLFTALAGQMRHIMMVMTGGVAVFSVLAAVVPAFQELLNKLPIIGDPEAVAAAAAANASPDDDKEYRQAIFEGALELIKDNMWFGLPNATSYLEYLKQGQGIVDIVNTYLGVALNFGMTGLLPFVGMFIIALLKMWRLRQRLDPGMDGWYLANSMIATLLTIMVMIFSTSSISIIPYVYYALLALTVSIEKIYSEPEYEPDRDVVIYRPPPFPRYAS
jgi:O-antigen ligase